MLSLSAYARHAGLSLTLLLVADTAAAAVPVTTGETDSGGPPLVSVVIVDPLDGATLAGTPDAVVPVIVEFAGLEGPYVGLRADDVAVGTCADQSSPCTLEVSLAPGTHTLIATAQAFADEPPIESDPVTVEVVEGEATGTGGAPTSGDSGDASGSSGSTGTGATSGPVDDPDGDKGCACSTRSGAPDLLGLALAVLLAPWRRRRPR